MVVIGYGTQRKGDVTSSVASVKADNFVKGAVKDVGQLIHQRLQRNWEKHLPGEHIMKPYFFWV